ncbi:hypothetical protein Ade02nite_29490 [Paractinoplanes deccanensis]|uniref:MmyB-like transcription regulator ligand binding domain-containing protein n=2 Tax=Paractinoplanes deccanensis TaxID=113561 RepID=A0ABQ3Y2T8_9ACTN|nr:hypothetical protein Ade02nite_29490 [Actinoplanes deccanensis]
MTVANLRTAAGKDPHDPELRDLIAELRARSDGFRRRWGAHDVRAHGTGVKQVRHPVVGELELSYQSLDLRDAPGLTMTVYTAEPGSLSAERLAMLDIAARPPARAASRAGTPPGRPGRPC